MEFYIARDGQQSGPFSEEEVRRKLTSGEILPTDRGWREGMAEWTPLSAFPNLAAPAAAGSAALIPSNGIAPSYYPPATTSGMAVASLVMGILSFTFFPILPAILAVIFGHSALSTIRSSQGRITGDGLAIAGLVLGYIWVGLMALGLVVLVIILIAAAIASAKAS